MLAADQKTISGDDQSSDLTLGHLSEAAVNLPLVVAGKDDGL